MVPTDVSFCDMLRISAWIVVIECEVMLGGKKKSLQVNAVYMPSDIANTPLEVA